MKTYIPWLTGYLISTMAWASNEGLEAYRLGQYAKSASILSKESRLDPASQYALGRMYLYGYGELKDKEEGLKYIRQAAEQGDVNAQLMLGKMMLGLDHDPVQALSWFKKAAEKNNLLAQRYCIAAYLYGFGTKKNEDSAERYAIMAAKTGDPFGQYVLGELFLKSRHTQNRKVGLAWLEKAANKHYAPAMTALAKMYREGQGGLSKDETKANLLLQEAMNQKYPKAMILYAQGLAAAGQATLAQSWIEKARAIAGEDDEAANELTMAKVLSAYQSTNLAQCGYGFSGILSNWGQPGGDHQYNPAPQMGKITKTAIFNPQWKMISSTQLPITEMYTAYMQSQPNLKKNLDIPRIALIRPEVTERLIDKAILGDSQAQFALGQLYQQGISVSKNIEEAIRYYNKAAAQQDLRAEYNLGLIYLEGETGKADYGQALGWLTDAAFKGSVDAQYVLGQISAQGYRDSAGEEVIPVDEDQAIAMFHLGSANGHGLSEFELAQTLSRSTMKNLSVQAQQTRYDLIHRLYADAWKKGVAAAKIPLAFFDAMSDVPEVQGRVFMVAETGMKKGDPLASLLLGILYDRGIGTDVSLSDAKKYYKAAGHNPVSLFVLGTYAADSDLLAQSEQMGFSYAALNHALLLKEQGQPFLSQLLQAKALENSEASLLLADYYLMASQDQSHFAEAKEIYQSLANKGDPLGQLKLGYILEEGLVTGAPDWLGAAYWYEQAARSGQMVAQYRLGRLNQLGLPNQGPNLDQAKKWYASANGKYSPSSVALGFLYDAEEDNYPEAIKHYTLAVEKQDPVAAYDLGVIYEKGKGVPVSLEKAQHYYQQAADQGHSAAKVQLARLKEVK